MYSLTSRYVAIHSAHTSPRRLRQQLLRTECLWQARFGGLAASDLCRLCQNSGGDTWCLNNCKRSHTTALKVHIMCLWIVTYFFYGTIPPFCGWRTIRKNCTPRKCGAIQYISAWLYLCPTGRHKTCWHIILLVHNGIVFYGLSEEHVQLDKIIQYYIITIIIQKP